MKTYTVVCVCCCGCDNNEIHWINAKSPEAAIKRRFLKDKRIVAVFRGAHSESRKDAK